MITREKLKAWCEPILNGKAYYRPFICNGDLSNADIFLAGINPATPIYSEEMDIDEYMDLLLDYNKFMELYKSLRLQKEKDEMSRTRKGMKSFIDYLKVHTKSSVLETDIIPYPTENIKLLKQEPREIIERGKEIFYEIVMEFQPRLIIFYGKKSVEHAYDIFASKGLIGTDSMDMKKSIENMERQGTVCSFTYSNGKPCTVMACRHFMYYGNSGQFYEEFRKKVLNVVKDIDS